MYEFYNSSYSNKEEFYENFILNIKGLIDGEHNLIANLANISSLGYHQFNDINWFGFYLYKEGQLVLGPFHGKPACIRIEIGEGVCGTAAKELKTQVVEDVHKFSGHIPCDSITNSEIVVPMFKGVQLIGVLDIDSPIYNRFDKVDQKFLEEVVSMIINQM